MQPHAYRKEIYISPLLPLSLTEGKIENVDIGDNEISVAFKQTADSDHFEIGQKLSEWKILFSQPKAKYSKWIINNKQVKPQLVDETKQVLVSGNLILVVLVK